MRLCLHWFMFGVYMTLGIIMVIFGALFLRTVFISLYLAQGEIAFSSLMLGIVLLMVGGGIVSSSIARYVKKVC
jgi:hypothetical protein